MVDEIASGHTTFVESRWFGEGSLKRVETGKNVGKWRLQWEVVDPSEKSGRRRFDRTFPLKRDAEAWRETKKAELLAGELPKPARAALTMQGWFDQLAGTKDEDFRDGKWVADGATPQTVGVKYSRWTRWVAGSPIAAVPLASLSRDHARAHVRRLKERGATHETIVDIVGVLKKTTNDAIRERREAKDIANPFEKLSLRTHEEEVLAQIERQRQEEEDGPEVKLLGPKAIRAALSRLDDPRRRAHLALHLLAGIRLSEQMALTREQVDFRRGLIVVDRAVHVLPSGHQYLGLPKGNKPRLVAMCPSLAAILREAIAALPGGGVHLFPAASEDKPRMRNLVYATWRTIRKDARLPAGMTTRMCRASHNNVIEKLMPTVSESTRLEHMGHSVRQGEGQSAGIVVNLRNYTGHIPEGHDVLRREIERVVGLG